MTDRHYAYFASALLIVVGLANVWLPQLYLPVIQGLIHVFAGLLGMYLTFTDRQRIFVAWLVALSLILSCLAFVGFQNILTLLKFDSFSKWFYVFMTLSGLWFLVGHKSSDN
ncbi:MAG TPA: hypothetical protein VEA37_05280 [Flavobacterium sp.]|nr:hypothetical protein [Flavobacterium sp.]